MDNPRKEEVILSKLCIGHTFLTQSDLLKGKDQPVCSTCQVPLIAKHPNCIDFLLVKKNIPKRKMLKGFFENINIKNLRLYLKTIKIYTIIYTYIFFFPLKKKRERERCNVMAKGFRFMPLSLVRLRTFQLSTWVS